MRSRQSRLQPVRPLELQPIGGNCDCSSLVIHCLREAGFDTGSATYTGNLSGELTKRGWTRLPANGNPQPGDILLNDVHHVAVYLGGGKLAQASISERGTAYGAAGDQTGRETNIRNYYSYPWNCYLRYQGAQSSAPAANSGAIAVDGNVGPATVRRWQQVMGTAVDGVISGQQVPDGRTYARPAIDSSVVRYGSGGSDRSVPCNVAWAVVLMVCLARPPFAPSKRITDWLRTRASAPPPHAPCSRRSTKDDSKEV
ncbi:MAG: NlpC/P60 family protein [Bifidobacterium sp.]